MSKRVRRGRFLSDFSPQRSGAAAASASPPKDDGRGDKYRGVGSDCHADNNGKGKVTQHRATEEQQAKNQGERHRTCRHGGPKRLVDTFIPDLLGCATTAACQALAHSVVTGIGAVDGGAGRGAATA